MRSLTVRTIVARSNRQLIDHVAVDRKSVRDLPNFVALLFRTDGTRQLDPVARNRYVYPTLCEGWIVGHGRCDFIGHFSGLRRRRVKSGSRAWIGAGGRTFNSPSTDRQTVINPRDMGKDLDRVDGTPPVSFGCDRPFEDNHSIADVDLDALKGRVSRELLLDFAPQILVTLQCRARRLRLIWRRGRVRFRRHGLCRLLCRKNSLPLPAE